MDVSVIVPAYNNPRELRECLSALRASSEPPTEILVVDDGSIDETAAVAAEMGVHVLRRQENGGPAAARNLGATHTRGEVLFFVDADVAVAPDGVARVARTFATSPELAAVFGSYDTRPRAPGVVSQYRNLLHHYVHQHGRADAFTFWAGCGAVRRTAFEAVGGFDERPVRRFIEDIELGYRLRQGGHRIRLDKEIQATHLKRWTLRSVLRTDLLYRAIPWARLMRERESTPADLNLTGGQRLSVALAGVALLGVALLGAALAGVMLTGGAAPSLSLVRDLVAMTLAALFGVVGLNRELYGFFRRERGLAFTLACVPLHLLYFLCSGVGFIFGWLTSSAARATRA